MPASITRVSGPAIVLRGRDIDTDRIMPARFLRAVTFEGLEAHVFEDDRAALARDGRTHPFDDPARRAARVLIVGANFGCGSSREHAPQALMRWGIRAIVGESFAEIFFGNSVAIGLPCVAAAGADIERLMRTAEADPEIEFVVELDAGRVEAGDQRAVVTLPATARQAFLSGAWDATGLLLENYEEVERVRARLEGDGALFHRSASKGL
jgi:3-isopropylmalate/(R)-2-methylmalate dehydratase small subunit